MKNIRSYHECEGGIEKSVPRITGDREDGFFLSFLHMNKILFLAHHCIIIIIFFNKLPEVPEYVKVQFHMMMLL